MEKKALIVVNLAGFLTFLWNDIQTLQDMGYSVSIAGNGKMQDGTWAIEIPRLEKMGIPFFQIDFDTKSPITGQNIKALKKLQDILKNDKFLLVHCHTPIVGMLARLAARRCRRRGTKVIYTTHGFAFTDRSSKKQWLIYHTMENFASRFCDGIITINHEDYGNAKNMHCKNVYCISGVGVDTKKFREVVVDRKQYREKLGVGSEDVMVLSVGELSARKNHQVIISAIGQLKNKEKYAYVICGREVINSGMEEYLKELATKNNVRLILAGHRSDIPEINKCADIAAIPSLREGLGLAGIEALASGVPVVGADVQGIREYVLDGEDGYLCCAESTQEFATAIEKLATISEKDREIMQDKCIDVAMRFDKSVSQAQMKKIYYELLEERM